MDLGAEGGVDDDPPVTEFVAEALHDDGAVVRDVAAGLALLVQVGQDVVRRPCVQARGEEAQAGVLLGQGADLAEERAHRAAQFEGRPSWSPFQNGSLPGTPGAGETRTRSRVMSSMRQELVPSVKTSPTRDS